MWIDGLKNEVTFVTFRYHYQAALLLPHFCLNEKMNNPEVNLSEQSVKECNSSLLLMIDSHHQQ